MPAGMTIEQVAMNPPVANGGDSAVCHLFLLIV
jgi:hypothetical protein